MANSVDPIILKIELDEARARVEIKKLNKEIKTAGNFTDDYRFAVKKLQTQELKLDNLQTKRTKHLADLSKSTENLSVQTKKVEKSTGGAATSVLELGRVVSDAPYGIRGMANNVSQLASNMLFGAQQIDKATGKAVGFTNVLKGMGKAFIGPLGILFAIQAVVAAVDFFFGGMKKAEDGAKKLGEQAGKSVGSFMRLNNILQDGRNSLDDRTEALRLLNKEFPDAIELQKLYSESLKSGNVNVQDAIVLEKEYTKTLVAEAKNRAVIELIGKEAGQLATLEDERETEIRETKKALEEQAKSFRKSDRERIKSSIETLESNYDLTSSFEDQTVKVKEAHQALSTFTKRKFEGRGAVLAFRSALEKNIEKIVESNDKITRLSDKTKNIFGKDAKKVAAKAAGDLLKALQKLSIDELKLEIKYNQDSLANGELTKTQKIKLIKDIYNAGLVILRKEKANRNQDLKESEIDIVKRKQNLVKFNADHLVLQQKLRSDLEALNASKKVTTIKTFPTPQEFDKELEDYLAQIAKVNEKLDLEEEENELKRIQIREDAHIARLEAKQLEFVEKFAAQAEEYKLELVAFLDQQLLMKKITQAEYDATLSNFTSNRDREIKENADGFVKLLEGWAAFYLEKKKQATKDAEDEAYAGKLKKLIAYTETAKQILGGIGDFIDAEFQRELVIEQNKTNVLNNELNARLANENLSKDERQAIQDEIAQNDEKLRVKQEAIERKRFKMQKALDIGMAIMDTAAAMMKALLIYGPTPVGFAAAGLAAAMGAIQVATIARQKFQSSASSSPRAAGGSNSSGSSGGSDREDPSFNIVGMSGNSQLLEAIQSQFDKPLQAYVVSREVTRQQNLDAAIQTGAGF